MSEQSSLCSDFLCKKESHSPVPLLLSRQRLPSSQKASFRSQFSFENSSRHFAIAPLSQKAIAFREPYLHFVCALGTF
nr:MAG TPA: type VI secretion protein [Caudoviricetes sp.]